MVRAVAGRVLAIFKDFTSVPENHYKGYSLTSKTNYVPSTTIYKIYIKDEGKARKDKHYGRNGRENIKPAAASVQYTSCSCAGKTWLRQDGAETFHFLMKT